MKVAGGSGGPGLYDSGVQMAKAFMESKTGGVGGSGGPEGPGGPDKKSNWLGRLVKMVKAAGAKVKHILTGGGGSVKGLGRRNAMRGGQNTGDSSTKPSGIITHNKLGAQGLGVKVMDSPEDPFGTNGTDGSTTKNKKLDRQNAVRHSTGSNGGKVNQSEGGGRD